MMKSAVCVLLLILSACKKGDSTPAFGATPEPDLRPQSYSRSASLNLSHTLESQKDIKNNEISFTGRGSSSSYKATYTFNSGNYDSLQIMSKKIKANFSSCSAPAVSKILLIANAKPVSAISASKISLEANQNYSLQIEFSNDCSSVEFKFDFVVWIGSSTEHPTMAMVCERIQGEQMTFLPNFNGVTAFPSRSQKDIFLDSSNYCGEKFQNKSVSCKNILDNEGGTAVVTCDASNESEKRNFNLKINSLDNSIDLSCLKNGTQVYFEKFQNCDSTIINYAQ
jgi:hypothetical protein